MKSKFISKIFLIGVIVIFSQNSIHAQSDDPITLSKNVIYADLSVALYSQFSVNYERLVYTTEKVSWYGRIGTGASSLFYSDGGPGGLAAITMLTGKKKGHFELNAGAFLIAENSDKVVVHPLFNVGYRYQKLESGMIYKVNLGILGIGLGIGYSF